MKLRSKVLIDVYYLLVAQTGIKTYIVSLCQEILAQPDSEFEYIISPNFRRISQNQFFRGKTPKWKNILFQLFYFIRKQIVIPFLSYYHSTDLVFSPDIMSPIWARGKKVSVIHDTVFWDNPTHYQRHWLRYYLFFLEHGLKKNGSIITVTNYSKNRLAEIPSFVNNKIKVVYPASELSYFESKNRVDDSKPNFRYFLHVGVLEKRKNLGLLIESFSMLIKLEGYADFKLVLIGQKGPRETLDDYDNLKNLVRQLGLEEQVIFTGYVGINKLISFFENAFVYIFPSLNEGFGLPVLEAFSFGLPVIISNQGALMEVAGGAALIFEKNEPEILFHSMKHLAENPNLRKKLSYNGRMRLNEFSPGNFFKSLEKAFKEILDE